MTENEPRQSGRTANSEASRIDSRLLEILVCPVTKATLEYDPVRNELISRAARLAFPIKDGIPIMLVEEARSLQPQD